MCGHAWSPRTLRMCHCQSYTACAARCHSPRERTDPRSHLGCARWSEMHMDEIEGCAVALAAPKYRNAAWQDDDDDELAFKVPRSKISGDHRDDAALPNPRAASAAQLNARSMPAE